MDTDNAYVRILIISYFLLIFSVVKEQYYPYFDLTNIDIQNYMLNIVFRYIHYLSFLFSVFFIPIFGNKFVNFDTYFYLLFLLHIVIGWVIFDGCYLSFSELLCYQIDLENIETTFNPTFHNLFDNYSSPILVSCGVLCIINVCFLLFYNKTIPRFLKIIYLFITGSLFINAIMTSRLKTTYYSIEKNKYLKYLQVINENFKTLLFYT